MTPVNLDQAIIVDVTGWAHAIVPRVIIGVVGFGILFLTCRAYWRKRCSTITACLWLLAGLAFSMFSVIPEDVIKFVITTPYMTRIRVIVAGVSVMVLLITWESIRRTHLQERYALLWITTSLILFVCALFPQAVALFRAVTGMEYATAIVAVAFTFLVLVAFHFSISMSAMQSKHSKVAQRVAILEARLKKLEEELMEKGK